MHMLLYTARQLLATRCGNCASGPQLNSWRADHPIVRSIVIVMFKNANDVISEVARQPLVASRTYSVCR